MKKVFYLILTIVVLLFAGCSSKGRMASFIPTPVPGESSSEDVAPTEIAASENATPVPETYDGPTVTKYVKLKEYGDVLNIRSAPSKDAEAVGFLTHAEKIEVIEIKDGWASFIYKGLKCYVNASYLVDEKPDYLEPPTPTPIPTPKAVMTEPEDTDGSYETEKSGEIPEQNEVNGPQI